MARRPVNAYDLEGKIAVITGGAGGIGRAIARLMLDSGARVALWDTAEAGLREAAEALGGGRVAARRVDVTAEDDVAAAAEAERAAHGRIDILVNNAGVLGPVKPVWEIEPADFRRVINVNLTGAFLCTRAVLAVMLAQPRPHRGSIVNIASIQAKEGMPLAGAYSASKAGLIALTKSLANEVARDGIVVTAVTPAAAETAMAREITPARRQEIVQRIPMGRFVDVEEIARMVTWLASDDCSFSTGAVFDLSGGRATW